MRTQNPVIVIPGITATNLIDDYPLKADEIWTMVFNKEYERVALHPDDMRYEAVEPSHVVAGAIPPFLPATRLVCVSDDDLEFLELRDRLLVGLGGFHGLLPQINLVQRLVTKHLNPGYRGEVWGRRLPGSRSWNPPIAGLVERDHKH